MISKQITVRIIILLFGMLTLSFLIQPSGAVFWGEVTRRSGSPFPDVDEFTLDFEISHVDWRIRWNYDAVGSTFESLLVMKLNGELFVYSSGYFDDDGVRNVYNEPGTFSLEVTCANVYEYTIIVEQDVDSTYARNVYIRPDGSVDPLTTPISTVDNINYVFTDNIYDMTIIVEKDNIVIDGNGYALQRTKALQNWSADNGIDLSGRTNVTVQNIQIINLSDGIILYEASSNNIIQNNIVNNSQGIISWKALGNRISANTIENNHIGILLNDASNNIITTNNITNNSHGIVSFQSSNNNIICHNNFFDNEYQLGNIDGSNIWDDGYPSGGNYWSDYVGQDIDEDGIGDTPYVINENNQDNYPLINVISEFPSWIIIPLVLALSVMLMFYTKRLRKGRKFY